jgi:hypothetical protein
VLFQELNERTLGDKNRASQLKEIQYACGSVLTESSLRNSVQRFRFTEPKCSIPVSVSFISHAWGAFEADISWPL